MKAVWVIGFMCWVVAAVSAANLSVPRFDGLGRHHHPITTRWPHQDTPAPGFNMPTLG